LPEGRDTRKVKVIFKTCCKDESGLIAVGFNECLVEIEARIKGREEEEELVC
jgi:hypothetical protein